jgi:hypothetical protein
VRSADRELQRRSRVRSNAGLGAALKYAVLTVLIIECCAIQTPRRRLPKKDKAYSINFRQPPPRNLTLIVEPHGPMRAATFDLAGFRQGSTQRSRLSPNDRSDGYKVGDALHVVEQHSPRRWRERKTARPRPHEPIRQPTDHYA